MTLNQLRFKYECVIATLKSYRWNPHRIPGICTLLCHMGRHDYEPFDGAICDGNGKPIGVHLECFYCERTKDAYFPS
jgi:hypothetical protein